MLLCGGEHPFLLVFSSLSRPWWECQILIEVGAAVVGCEKVRIFNFHRRCCCCCSALPAHEEFWSTIVSEIAF